MEIDIKDCAFCQYIFCDKLNNNKANRRCLRFFGFVNGGFSVSLVHLPRIGLSEEKRTIFWNLNAPDYVGSILSWTNVRYMIKLYCVIERSSGVNFTIIRCPLVLRRRVMPYEHNWSTYFVASNFCGSVLHRQS